MVKHVFFCTVFRLEGLLDVLSKFYLVLPKEDFWLLTFSIEAALAFVSRQLKVAPVASGMTFLLSVVAETLADRCC